MTPVRRCAALGVLASAAALTFAAPASAAVYQLTPIPPIGTVYSDNIVTLGVAVGPVPVGADATTPVRVTVTEPDGDTHTATISLTAGVGTVATRIHEEGRYTATFTYEPPSGDTAEASVQFDAVRSPFSLS